jgi:GntR family transcriptional regulator / MocR family aminotransferase
MRSAYRERLEALIEAADRWCKGELRLRPVPTGLHAVADLDHASAERVFEEAAARSVETMPLSSYYLSDARPQNALVLGFASSRPEGLAAGMEHLAASIEAARVAKVRG